MLLNDEYPDVTAALAVMRLPPADSITPLSGGVSCDVWLVRSGARAVCVKRALPRLRVAADWRAPADRSHAEVAWFKLVAGIDPNWVPEVVGEDRARHMFAMEYFPPETHPVWKGELAAGRADPAFAARVGDALSRIHGETAGRDDIARAFANGVPFLALRIDAYLLFTAVRHADVAPAIRTMAKNLGAARIALMHGDVSPKNILVGPEGPVFIDAETCCYGDPAFDLAFCLNHLLLKAIWHPEHLHAYAQCFTALADAYFAGADWEARQGLEKRTAGLLAAFLLARVDGKSPAEYITADADKAFVRAVAKSFLKGGESRLDRMLARWTEALPTRQI
jgi:aminoglycoside phosphotransferase (APT) family kinase protein